MMLIDLCNNVLIWCARCCVGASEAAQNGIYKESSQRCPKRVYFSFQAQARVGAYKCCAAP